MPVCSQGLKPLLYSKFYTRKGFVYFYVDFFFYLWNVAHQSRYSIVFTEMCFGRYHHSVLGKLRHNPTELIAVTTEKMFIILLCPLYEDPWEEFVY